jgi:hypothetical protein
LPGESSQNEQPEIVPALRAAVADVADSGTSKTARQAPQAPQGWQRIPKTLFTFIFTVLAGGLGILGYFNLSPSVVVGLLSLPVIGCIVSLGVLIVGAYVAWKRQDRSVDKKLVAGVFIAVVGAGVFGYALAKSGGSAPAASTGGVNGDSYPIETNPPTSGLGADATAGRVTIHVTPQKPGSCSKYYLVEGDVINPPAKDNSLSVVSELYADPPNGLDNALYYAKRSIGVRSGPYSITLEANMESGVRTGRFLVVEADEGAQKQLQLDVDSSKARDNRYPDTKRWRLPYGSKEIAGTLASDQRC